MDDQNSLRSGFVDPNKEYGPVPLWWWDGDELDEQRLTDQLETLAEGGISGVCIIEKHPTGYAGDEVDYFSEEWWEYIEHVTRECDRLGMFLWVHDETYHHSPPNHRKFWQHRLEVEVGSDPDLRGEALRHVGDDAFGGTTVNLTIPDSFDPVSAGAYPRSEDGTVHLEEKEDISFCDDTDAVEWTAPEGDRKWHVAVVGREPVGLRYTTRDVVDRYIDLHFEEYARRLGDHVGDVLVGTFEDELLLLQPGYPHDKTINVPGGEEVFDRFREEHGYDPEARLIALFEDIGAETARFRVDYYDIVTTLLEECWFEPLYEWHEEHDLHRSHDNFGRLSLAKQTIQYGDYMRTMRWYQAPGYDDGNIDPKAIETVPHIPIGERNFFDARLSASIAAAYERPRVWGELFHSTGWGYPPEAQLAGIVENVCYGMNWYDKHGLYYSTSGGWWEHAPPDTHFRQPYWDHIEDLNDAATRLSYLFSRGEPGFDTALFYPASTMQAQWHPTDGIDDLGHDIDDDTRELLASIYHDGRDPVFLDRESLVRADTDGGQLHVGDIDVPALVLGPTTAIRADVLEAIREFFDDGGVVVAVGRLPASAAGADDEEILADTLEHVFGTTTVPTTGYSENIDKAGGVGLVVAPDESVSPLLDARTERGVDAPEGIYHGHRRTDDGHVYLLLNTDERERTETVTLRGDGTPELWDVLEGDRRSLECERNGDCVDLTLSFAPHEHRVVVISEADTAEHSSSVGTTARAGSDNSAEFERIALEGNWEIEPLPSLNNEWGDFRYPPSDEVIGPEVRSFAYRAERPGEDGFEADWHRSDVDDHAWDTVEWSVGPYCWRAVTEGEETLLSPIESRDQWTPYEFSRLVGIPETIPRVGGLVGRVSDQFLSAPDRGERVHFWTTVRAETAGSVVCHYGPNVERLQIGDRTVVGGTAIPSPDSDGGTSTVVLLPAGLTPVHLTVEPGTNTHLAFERPPATADENRPVDTPRLPWFDGTDALAFDAKPWDDDPVGWYRFEIPPGTRAFSVPAVGDPTAWVGGVERPLRDGHLELETPLSEPTPVAVRVEQFRGKYGGAAWTAPVELDVESAQCDLADWREIGLESYSGIMRYAKTVTIPTLDEDERIVLDLGEVAVSAAVSVNGTPIGERFARPYQFDITEAVTAGENQIEIEVANTLANHFADEVPTDYVYDELNQCRSGLFGPVTVCVWPA